MNEQPPIEPPVRFPRKVADKVYFLGATIDGAELMDPRAQSVVENYKVIQENLENNMTKGSPARELIRQFLSPTRRIDVFDFQDQASKLVDVLAGGTEDPDYIDFMLALRSYVLVSEAATSDWEDATRSKQGSRSWNLTQAFAIELAARMPLMLKDDSYTMGDIYERLFGGKDQEQHPDVHEVMRMSLDGLAEHITSRTFLVYGIAEEGRLQTPEPNDEAASYNAYNRPLARKSLDDLNRAAADAVERIHLLKAYPIAPMIVPAETIELPWDIAVHPPLRAEGGELLDEYDPGALADFFLLKPDPGRTQALRQVLDDSKKRTNTRMVNIGGGEAAMRFRLHDNGQISFGSIHHNVPGDHAEALFFEIGAEAAFARLRALMIAITFDAIVPEEVVRKNIGGSVPRQYQKLREQSLKHEVIPEIVLSRVRELRAQGIGRENRKPRTWEIPTHSVVGHTKRVPQGMRPRPEANEEAREYYRRIGREFEGLKEDETFVDAYKRGSKPEEVTFRRARFRGRSVTARFLGASGIRGK